MNTPAAPTLSVIIPAYNEEALLGRTLAHLHAVLLDAGVSAGDYELVVCDNASSDDTPRIAAAAGARVVHESHRQISRARNAGAAVARGRWLVFVDADTWPSAALLREALALLAGGRCCGGGSVVCGRDLPARLRPLVGGWNLLSRIARVACGAFVFCDATAFRAIGGFSTELYAAEELDLSRRMARWGRPRGRRFTIITLHPLETSMRKLELYGATEMLAMLLRGMRNPLGALKDRQALKIWYDGRR
jgi:glycosyltransferase involved in cell wall biosynthesis